MDINKFKEKIKKIKQENELIGLQRAVKKMKRENNQDTNLKVWGWIFGLIGFGGFLASTGMSITAGIKDHRGLSLMAFVIGVCFIQLVVYVICIKESIIKNKFSRYYAISKFVQFGLLAISINYNFKFYEEKTFWNFLLSVLLEVAVIVITTIGGDFRILNFQEVKRINSDGLFSVFAMWIYNKLHKTKIKIVKEYNENMNDLTKDQNVLTKDQNVLTSNKNESVYYQELEPVKTELKPELNPELEPNHEELKPNHGELKPIIMLKEKDLTILKKEIETYLYETCKNGGTIQSGKIKDTFNLTEKQWIKIRNQLDCIESRGTKLIYINNENCINE